MSTADFFSQYASVNSYNQFCCLEMILIINVLILNFEFKYIIKFGSTIFPENKILIASKQRFVKSEDAFHS